MEKSEVTLFLRWWPLSAWKVAFSQESKTGYPTSLPPHAFSLSKTIKLYMYLYMIFFTEVLIQFKMITKKREKLKLYGK